MMSRQVKKYKKGFTVIEVLVVIAILGIVSAIAIPNLSGFSEKARVNADEASLSTLNKATDLYAVLNNMGGEDIFAGLSSDEDRMLALVNKGLLEKTTNAQQEDTKFAWDIEGQHWNSVPLYTGAAVTKQQAEAMGFTFSRQTGAITSYEGSDTDVEIPYRIGGVLVTQIEANVFADRNLTSVMIPNSITEIGEYAFKNNNLTSLVIPDSVTALGKCSFQENELESVIIPSSVKELKQFTFQNNKLKTVKIPTGVKMIERNVFANNELKEVELSDTVGTVGDYAFSNNQLEVITFPSSVKVIGNNAFEKNQIQAVTIPNTARDIWQEVFLNNKITYIDIQGTPEKMYGGIFNQNGPDSDIDFNIGAGDCPGIFEMNENGEWVRQ